MVHLETEMEERMKENGVGTEKEKKNNEFFTTSFFRFLHKNITDFFFFFSF